MGANLARAYASPSTELQPGTYRIVNVLSRTFLEVHDQDHTKVVARSSQHTGQHQEWFVQRAGGGYRFKNCESKTYLVTETTESKALVRASEYPATWVLHKQSGDTFLMQVPLNDRVIHLSLELGIEYSSKEDSEKRTKITIRTVSDPMEDNLLWRFENVSGVSDTEIESLNNEIDCLNNDIESLNNDIENLNKELSTCRAELDETTRQLQESNKDNERLRLEIAELKQGAQ